MQIFASLIRLSNDAHPPRMHLCDNANLCDDCQSRPMNGNDVLLEQRNG